MVHQSSISLSSQTYRGDLGGVDDPTRFDGSLKDLTTLATYRGE